MLVLEVPLCGKDGCIGQQVVRQHSKEEAFVAREEEGGDQSGMDEDKLGTKVEEERQRSGEEEETKVSMEEERKIRKGVVRRRDLGDQ